MGSYILAAWFCVVKLADIKEHGLHCKEQPIGPDVKPLGTKPIEAHGFWIKNIVNLNKNILINELLPLLQ